MSSQSPKDSPEKQLEKLVAQLRASNKAMQKIIEKNRAEILGKSGGLDDQDDLESLKAHDMNKARQSKDQ